MNCAGAGMLDAGAGEPAVDDAEVHVPEQQGNDAEGGREVVSDDGVSVYISDADLPREPSQPPITRLPYIEPSEKALRALSLTEMNFGDARLGVGTSIDAAELDRPPTLFSKDDVFDERRFTASPSPRPEGAPAPRRPSLLSPDLSEQLDALFDLMDAMKAPPWFQLIADIPIADRIETAFCAPSPEEVHNLCGTLFLAAATHVIHLCWSDPEVQSRSNKETLVMVIAAPDCRRAGDSWFVDAADCALSDPDARRRRDFNTGRSRLLMLAAKTLERLSPSGAQFFNASGELLAKKLADDRSSAVKEAMNAALVELGWLRPSADGGEGTVIPAGEAPSLQDAVLLLRERAGAFIEEENLRRAQALRVRYDAVRPRSGNDG